MIDRKFIGWEFPEAVWEVEKGRLCFFAKAIGENNPVYLDKAAARAAGYRALPAPPTFLFGALSDTGAVTAMLDKLGVDIGRILHGEQQFTYHMPVCAGDVLRVRSRITDIYDKKGGALEFIVLDSSFETQDGAKVAGSHSVIVVRNT